MIFPRSRTFLAAFALSLSVSGFPASARGSTPLVSNPTARQAPVAAPKSANSNEPQSEVKAYTLLPALYEKAVKFSRAEYILYFVDFIWGVVVLLLVLAWLLAPKYRNFAEQITKRRFLQAAIYAPILLLTLGILQLPTSIYGHWLTRSYGLSIQGWGSWMWDWTKGEIISLIVGILAVWILYAVMRWSPRRWWFHFWVVVLIFVFVGTFVTPVMIDPMFNKFEPLEAKDPELVTALEKVVHKAGMDIPPDRMFWMQESAKGTEVDAYVTGLGASKRVVVWDTTIQKMTVPETMYVFGHEMGHYVLNHVYKGLLFSAVLSFILIYLGFRGMLWLLARWSSRWGIRSTDDWASLPVLMLCIAILGFFTSPVVNGFSRYQEHHADQYGLEVTHGLIPDSSQVAAQSFEILGEVDLADPDPNPFIRFWLFSHPPEAERVKFALTYDPWAEGKQPEFVK